MIKQKNNNRISGLLAHKTILGMTLMVSLCSCARKADAQKKTTDTVPAVPVKTAEAQFKPMERSVVVTGSFHAREQATLTVKVPGRLEKIAVDVGSVVNKGDLLAQIERSDYDLRAKQSAAALAQARARLGLSLDGKEDQVKLEDTGPVREAKALLVEATKNRERVRQLAREKISSQSELDTVEAAYTVAATRYETALEDVRERLALVVQRRAALNLTSRPLSARQRSI